jgi:hypothetical protein
MPHRNVGVPGSVGPDLRTGTAAIPDLDDTKVGSHRARFDLGAPNLGGSGGPGAGLGATRDSGAGAAAHGDAS